MILLTGGGEDEKPGSFRSNINTQRGTFKAIIESMLNICRVFSG